MLTIAGLQMVTVLLKLVSLSRSDLDQVAELDADKNIPSVRKLAELTGVGKTEVSSSINRSLDVGLARIVRKDNSISVNTKSLLEFIVYGIKFVFPARPAELVRGMPTAHAAPIMTKHLLGNTDSVLVWSDASSSVMGQSLKPLYKTVPFAAAADAKLYGYLALVDAIRVGGPRELGIATKLLESELRD